MDRYEIQVLGEANASARSGRCRIDPMEMHQIRYFLAVCRTLNFTKAAEECHVAQPSLTRAVRKLEDELGGPLLHRERANTHLTELGRLVLPHLLTVYEAALDAKRLATGLKKGDVAPLRIGLDASVPADPVVAALRRVRDHMGAVDLSLKAGTRRDVIEAALNGAHDLIVVSDAGDLPERFHRRALYTESCVCIVPEGHPWSTGRPLPVSMLDGAVFIARTDCCLSEIFLDACRKVGAEPALRHSAEDEGHLQQLVLAGFGVAMSPETVPLRPGLVRVPLAGQAFERQVVMATVSGRRLPLAARALMKIAHSMDWQMSVTGFAVSAEPQQHLPDRVARGNPDLRRRSGSRHPDR